MRGEHGPRGGTCTPCNAEPVEGWQGVSPGGEVAALLLHEQQQAQPKKRVRVALSLFLAFLLLLPFCVGCFLLILLAAAPGRFRCFVVMLKHIVFPKRINSLCSLLARTAGWLAVLAGAASCRRTQAVGYYFCCILPGNMTARVGAASSPPRLLARRRRRSRHRRSRPGRHTSSDDGSIRVYYRHHRPASSRQEEESISY